MTDLPIAPIDVLHDDRYRVPEVPPANVGLAWLRASAVRFNEDSERERRRRLVDALLAEIDPRDLERPGDHVATLARALGLPGAVAGDVRRAAAGYQPHVDPPIGADEAVARLVDVCGGSWDERTAAVLCILVQACDATAALIAGGRPPVRTTRRVAPDGRMIDVPLDDAPYGTGRHACPGREHAEALARGADRFRRLHDGPGPLLLPNAWDVASATALARAGMTAIGTTSLGVAAAHGVPDGDGSSLEPALGLARQLATLPVPISVDLEAGLGIDLAGVAAELWQIGVAGVNIEDGRGRHLVDIAEQARLVRTLKDAAPGLFVNARTDTHWIGVQQDWTIERLHAYVDAGADGVFVPGLTDELQVSRVVEAVPVPVNVLAFSTLPRLGKLGVRRVSTGSLLFRVGLSAAVGAATEIRSGSAVADLSDGVLSYDDADSLQRLLRSAPPQTSQP